MKTLRLARPGVNALTATAPNNFIFAPDWNTPKIVKEGVAQPTLSGTGSETFYDVAHGLNYTPFVIPFVQFADNKVSLIGSRASTPVEFYTTNLRVNSSNIRFGYNNVTGSNYSPKFKYLALEFPLAGTPSVARTPGRKIVISKPGINALTDINPNNKIYDSQFGTIKYYEEGVKEYTIVGTVSSAGVSYVSETVLFTHNLGYYPMFGANQEYSVDDPGILFPMPMSFSDAGFWTYDTVYTTTTQLIFRREFGDAFGGTPWADQTIKIYWKLYSKDLGL